LKKPDRREGLDQDADSLALTVRLLLIESGYQAVDPVVGIEFFVAVEVERFPISELAFDALNKKRHRD
jgi:hypothetical protein